MTGVHGCIAIGKLGFNQNQAQTMTRIVQHRKRLKGLHEFKTPPFVGRMERVRRLRLWLWRLMLAVAVAVGVLVGLLIF